MIDTINPTPLLSDAELSVFERFSDDIIGHVISFMTVADLSFRFRQLNRRLYVRASAELNLRLGMLPRCFLSQALLSRVELAMPSTVKSITFDHVSHRLYVATMGDTASECILYEHLVSPENTAETYFGASKVFTEQHKGRFMQRISLPNGEAIENAHFEGPFLTLRSLSEATAIFDCRNQEFLELPMGYVGLFASSSGRRMAAVCDHDDSRMIVVFVSPIFNPDNIHGDASEHNFSPTSSTSNFSAYAQYRAANRRMAKDGNLLTSPLAGSLSSPWREGDISFPPVFDGAEEFDSESTDEEETGSASTEASWAPVVLVPSFKTLFTDTVRHIITDTFIVALSSRSFGSSAAVMTDRNGSKAADRSCWVLSWMNCNITEATGDTIVQECVLPSEFFDVGSIQALGEDRCVLVEAHFRMLVICDLATGFQGGPSSCLKIVSCITKPWLRCMNTHVMCSAAYNLSRGNMSFDGVLCCIGVHNNNNQIILLSLDGSLVRLIRTPHNALVAVHPLSPFFISANDTEESLPDHPLLQALEGGYGSLIRFEQLFFEKRMRSEDTDELHLEPTHRALSSNGVFNSLTRGLPSIFRPQSTPSVAPYVSFQQPADATTTVPTDRLTIVLYCCYGILLLALVWTAFALVYNGWWLYMQKLVSVFR